MVSPTPEDITCDVEVTEDILAQVVTPEGLAKLRRDYAAIIYLDDPTA
jgi:hypothetical protein